MPQPASEPADGRHDFDFLIGHWSVANRRLDRRLVGSDTWLEFDATSEGFSCLGGIGNVDQYHAVLPDGQPLFGMTTRIFNPEDEVWRLYWSDSQSAIVFPPVVGRFENGIGEFRGDDVQDGVPVQVRYRWSGITSTTARWEQAMRADDGAIWEWNWVMEFTRVAAPAKS